MTPGLASRWQQVGGGASGLQQLKGMGASAVAAAIPTQVCLGLLQLVQLTPEGPQGPLHLWTGLCLQQQPCCDVPACKAAKDCSQP